MNKKELEETNAIVFKKNSTPPKIHRPKVTTKEVKNEVKEEKLKQKILTANSRKGDKKNEEKKKKKSNKKDKDQSFIQKLMSIISLGAV